MNPAARPAGRWSHEQGATRITETLALIEKPVIAKLNGHASSNGQSILFGSDLIVAWEDAIVAENHLGLGEVTDENGVPHGYPFAMVPGDGAGALVPLFMPPTKAKEYLFLSPSYTAKELAEMNIVNKAVPLDHLDAVDRRLRATAAQTTGAHPRPHQAWREQDARSTGEPGLRRAAVRRDAWTSGSRVATAGNPTCGSLRRQRRPTMNDVRLAEAGANAAANAEDMIDPRAAFDLTGRSALVTGASSGLGWRFAQVLAACGASVIATARRTERLEALARTSPRISYITADLGVASERERLIGEAERRTGGLDVLVNNAGLSDPKPIERESLDDFARVLEVNLTAVWHLAKLAGAGMVERQRGSIVNIASILGLVGSTPLKQTGYTTAKGAVVNLTRELALQWARKGVRVNAIAPGWFTSEMTAEMSTESGLAFIAANGPMPRLGDPKELDGALMLLASDAGSFMTGATIVVDGGWTAR